MQSLSTFEIPHTDRGSVPLKDYGTTTDARTKVIFRDLESEVVRQIEQCSLVIGCVAWLTHPRILAALRKPQFGCSLVVQKEDFLRPETQGDRASWKQSLRRAYDQLFCGLDRFNVGGLVGSLSWGGDPTLPAVRCVGNHNSQRLPAFPRMHNKFLVFCCIEKEAEPDEETQRYPITPYAVWTGSFNFTDTATKSFENAVLLESEVAANAFWGEWQQILSLSEPLDWSSDWIEPEWRIGS